MEIVSIDENIMKELPNIYQLIYDVYKYNTISMYSFYGDGVSGFICTDGHTGLYVDKKIHRLFETDDNFNFLSYKNRNYRVVFGNPLCFIDEQGVEYKIDYIKVDKKENLGYDANICYTIYYPEKDLFVQFSYLQNYREQDGKTRIYNLDSEDYDSVYIEEGYSKSNFSSGFIPKRINAYNRIIFEEDDMSSGWDTIIKYGLKRLLKDDDLLDVDNKNIGFVKACYLDKNGTFRNMGWLARLYQKKEIDELIQSYGIDKNVKKELIDLYNGDDYCMYRIKEILTLLQKEEKRELGFSLTLRE